MQRVTSTPRSKITDTGLIERIRDSEAESVAICFLFSFLNHYHERLVGQAIRAQLPDIEISLSSDIQPEFREYERLSTTVLNAYLQPLVGAT